MKTDETSPLDRHPVEKQPTVAAAPTVAVPSSEPPPVTHAPAHRPEAGEDHHAHAGHPEGHDAHPAAHPHHPPHRNHPARQLPPKRGKRWTGIVAGVALVGSMLALGIAPRIRQEKKLAILTPTKAGATPVNVVLPHYARSVSSLTLPGSIQAIEEATINARTSGYLRKRYVDIGSRVHAGQLLAVIESPEVDEELMQARAETSKSQAGSEQAVADVARLQANVAQAQAELARTQSNLQGTRADLAHTQAKQLEAESALAESEAKLQQSRKRLNARRSDLARMKTRSALAEITYKRWQELAKGGAVSGQDLDETKASYESSQADVTGAQADVETAQADIDAAQAVVRSSQGNLAAAKADVTAAEQKIAAAQAAVVSGRANITAMQAAVQASRANVRATTSNVAASEAGVNRYAALKGFEQVVAPFDGVITARNVDAGALINAGSNPSTALDPTRTVPHSGLFGIARTDILRIQVNVPEAYIDSIRLGQTARLLIQELPGRVFTGIVARKAGALDAESRTMLVEVHIPNPRNVLIPGMYAQVEFAGGGTSRLLRVPADTLVIDSAGTRVATVTKDNTVHYEAIHLGRDFGKEVEITQDLEPNTELIENPTDDLKEGTPVQIVAAGNTTQ
jgi:RND family efflux transporter MFP subunit